MQASPLARWLRPLLPGITDREGELEALAAAAKKRALCGSTPAFF